MLFFRHILVVLLLIFSVKNLLSQKSWQYIQQSDKSYGTDMDSVPIYLNMAITEAIKEKNDTIKYEAYIHYINFYGVTSEKTKGDSLLQLTLKTIRNQKYIAKLYIAAGYLYKELGDFKSAQKYLLNAYETGKSLNDHYILCGSCLNLSRIFKTQRRYDLANEYGLKSIEYAKKGNIQDKLENCYNQMASLYKLEEKFQESETYYQKVKEIVDKNQDAWGKIILNNNLGNLYTVWKKYAQAENLFKENIRLSQETNNDEMYYYSFFELATLKFQTKEYSNAQYYIDRALSGLNYLQNNLDMHDVYWQAYLVYKENKDYPQALLYHEKWKDYSDTLNKMNTDKLLLETEAQFRNQEKQQQIEILGKQNALKESEISKKNTILIASGIFTAFIAAFLILIIFTYRKLRVVNKKLEFKNVQIEEQKREILDSINYAQKIQNATLGSPEEIQNYYPTSAIIFKPKDILSGDFYWYELKDHIFLFAVADCTGHGVPGAMMSMIGLDSLKEAVNKFDLTSPSKILEHLSSSVKHAFIKNSTDIKDTMDISLCALDMQTNVLKFSGAINSLYLVRNGQLTILKGDKMYIGNNDQSFQEQSVSLLKGDALFLISDGYTDQFGGGDGKKFKTSNFKKLIGEVSHLPSGQIYEILNETISNWKGNMEQTDDITCLILKV